MEAFLVPANVILPAVVVVAPTVKKFPLAPVKVNVPPEAMFVV